MQLIALLRGQGCEELVLSIAKGLISLSKAARASWRNGHHVSATVVCVALAPDQPLVLERIQQVHEDAVVDPHEFSQLALADGTPVVEQIQNPQLARLQAVSRQDFPDMARELLTEHGESEPGPGVSVAEDLAGLVRA